MMMNSTACRVFATFALSQQRYPRCPSFPLSYFLTFSLSHFHTFTRPFASVSVRVCPCPSVFALCDFAFSPFRAFAIKSLPCFRVCPFASVSVRAGRCRSVFALCAFAIKSLPGSPAPPTTASLETNAAHARLTVSSLHPKPRYLPCGACGTCGTNCAGPPSLRGEPSVRTRSRPQHPARRRGRGYTRTARGRRVG